MCYCYWVSSTQRDFRISSISALYRLQDIKVNYNQYPTLYIIVDIIHLHFKTYIMSYVLLLKTGNFLFLCTS